MKCQCGNELYDRKFCTKCGNMLEDYDIKGLENEESDHTVIQQIEEEVMLSGYSNIHDFINNNKYGSLFKIFSILAFVVFYIVFTIDKLHIGLDFFTALWYAFLPAVLMAGGVMLGLNFGIYQIGRASCRERV